MDTPQPGVGASLKAAGAQLAGILAERATRYLDVDLGKKPTPIGAMPTYQGPYHSLPEPTKYISTRKRTPDTDRTLQKLLLKSKRAKVKEDPMDKMKGEVTKHHNPNNIDEEPLLYTMHQTYGDARIITLEPGPVPNRFLGTAFITFADLKLEWVLTNTTSTAIARLLSLCNLYQEYRFRSIDVEWCPAAMNFAADSNEAIEASNVSGLSRNVMTLSSLLFNPWDMYWKHDHNDAEVQQTNPSVDWNVDNTMMTQLRDWESMAGTFRFKSNTPVRKRYYLNGRSIISDYNDPTSTGFQFYLDSDPLDAPWLPTKVKRQGDGTWYINDTPSMGIFKYGGMNINLHFTDNREVNGFAEQTFMRLGVLKIDYNIEFRRREYRGAFNTLLSSVMSLASEEKKGISLEATKAKVDDV